MGIYKLAVSVILVHNHPAPPGLPKGEKPGSLIITESNRLGTDRFLKSGKILGIEVLDHLIITEENYISFADMGVVEELKNSGLFEVIGPERKELEEWKLKEERKRGKKEGLAQGIKKGM